MFFSKKKPSEPINNDKIFQIPYSKGFRGFKRFPMVVHGDKEAEKNNESLYGKDLSGSIFEIMYSPKDKKACLYIDKLKAGTFYDADQLQSIGNGLIEMIHIEPKDEVVIVKDGSITRHRMSVLVKYKEQ